jgi:hypothetical protein
VQLINHVNIGKFLHLHLECDTCDTIFMLSVLRQLALPLETGQSKGSTILLVNCVITWILIGQKSEICRLKSGQWVSASVNCSSRPITKIICSCLARFAYELERLDKNLSEGTTVFVMCHIYQHRPHSTS